jgi:hypothetical protein
MTRLGRTVVANVGAVTPGVNSASRDNCLSIGDAEAIRSAQVSCITAYMRAGTLCIIRIPVSEPVVAGYAFAGTVVLLY